VVWTYRVVETPDRRWQCRFGMTTFDEHLSLGDAVSHMARLAESAAPATVVLHKDGAPPETVLRFPYQGPIDRRRDAYSGGESLP
jgi:hypothetical protein